MTIEAELTSRMIADGANLMVRHVNGKKEFINQGNSYVCSREGTFQMYIAFQSSQTKIYLPNVKDSGKDNGGVLHHHIDGKLISFIGEITHESSSSLYGNALATLFPITWHEPFGLVMVESMACGTPVVAYNFGSVPEIIEDGKTGFVVDSNIGVVGLVHAVRQIERIKRGDCRSGVVARFSKEKMVSGYEEVYGKILAKNK